MAGKKTIAITDRQFSVMSVLWDRGPLTVRELLEAIPGGDNQPYTTVLALLQTMEKSGLVTHSKEGQIHRYAPTVGRQEATSNLLGDILKRFFGGSAERLVLGLVDSQHLSPEELRSIESKIDSASSPNRRSKSSKAKKE